MRGKTDGFGDILHFHIVPTQPEDLLIGFGQRIPERLCFDSIPNRFLQLAVGVKAEVRPRIVVDPKHIRGNLRRVLRVRMIPANIEIGLIKASARAEILVTAMLSDILIHLTEAVLFHGVRHDGFHDCNDLRLRHEPEMLIGILHRLPIEIPDLRWNLHFFHRIDPDRRAVRHTPKGIVAGGGDHRANQ